MKTEFLTSTFRCIRQARQQFESVPGKQDRLTIRKATDGVYSSGLQIHHRPRMIRATFKVHRKLGSYFSGAFTIDVFTGLANLFRGRAQAADQP